MTSSQDSRSPVPAAPKPSPARRLVALTYSLKLAVFVLVALSLALAAGTITESAYDTPTAKFYVYQSWWFRSILVLLAVNLFAVMVSRWPWKGRHAPFLLAHIGILILLFGSWVTDRYGIDGSLRINEGETARVVELDQPALAIIDGERFEIFPVDWQPPTADFHERTLQAGFGFPILIDQYISHAEPLVKFLPASAASAAPGAKLTAALSRAGLPTPAVKLTVAGGPMKIRQDYWMWSGNPAWSGLQAGPAWLSFGSDRPATGELHAGGPNLILHAGADGSLGYRAYSSSGELVQGRLPAGQIQGRTLDPKWKGVSITIAEWIPDAQLDLKYKPSRSQWGEMAPPSAIHLRPASGSDSEGVWLGLGDRANLKSGDREIAVEYFRRRTVLPFGVKLDRFTIDRYQGSSSPAEYSSRVTVTDSRAAGRPATTDGAAPSGEGITISMNQPLDRGGFKVYQASYEEGMPRPTVSIFSVNQDPGRPWKYLGSLLIVFGTILLFAMKYWKKRKAPVMSPTAAPAAIALLVTGSLLAGFAAGAPASARAAETAPASAPAATAPANAATATSAAAAAAHARAATSTSAPALPPAGTPGAGESAVPPTQHSGWSFGEARSIPIQGGGRIKPLDSFARETVLFVTGSSSFKGWQPLDLVFSWLANPAYWDQQQFITISRPDVRRQLGVDETRRHYSPRELRQNYAFVQYAQNMGPGGEANTTTGGPQGAKASGAREQELRRVLERLGLFQEVVAGGALTLIPRAGNEAWLPLNAEGTAGTTIGNQFGDMLRAYVGGEVDAFDRASLLTRKAVEGEISAGNESALQKIGAEVTYNRLRPFMIAWILYLAAAIAWLASGNPSRELASARPDAPAKPQSSLLRRSAMGLTVLAMLTHIGGIAIRCYIAGRPPVTNMYESIVFVMIGQMVFATILYAIRRQSILLVVGCALATLGLIAADANPTVMDPGLHPLVPVLRSNYWLTIHVLTITLGYAAFALTLGLADVTMYQFLRRRAGHMAKINELNQLTYRATQFGVVLLAAGTILGGVWADASWGRFWGWDPKETWALIALLSYVAILHGRLTNWMSQFAYPAWTIVGFLSVLMAWYGVNFILGAGLHSYGFSTGGLAWVCAFTVLQLGYVGFTAFVLREKKKAAAVAPVIAP